MRAKKNTPEINKIITADDPCKADLASSQSVEDKQETNRIAPEMIRIQAARRTKIHGYPKLGGERRKQGAEWLKRMSRSPAIGF